MLPTTRVAFHMYINCSEVKMESPFLGGPGRTSNAQEPHVSLEAPVFLYWTEQILEHSGNIITESSLGWCWARCQTSPLPPRGHLDLGDKCQNPLHELLEGSGSSEYNGGGRCLPGGGGRGLQWALRMSGGLAGGGEEREGGGEAGERNGGQTTGAPSALGVGHWGAMGEVQAGERHQICLLGSHPAAPGGGVGATRVKMEAAVPVGDACYSLPPEHQKSIRIELRGLGEGQAPCSLQPWTSGHLQTGFPWLREGRMTTPFDGWEQGRS